VGFSGLGEWVPLPVPNYEYLRESHESPIRPSARYRKPPGIGDPAIDFACLYAWYGESWLENILAHYTGKLDAQVISRSRYLAACLAIHNITLGRDMGRVQWVEAGYAALELALAG